MSRALSLACAFILALPVAGLSQEGEGYEYGQLSQVSTWEVDPAEAAAFETAVKKVAEAAAMAKTPYRWAFWQNGSRYTLVFPVGSFGYFDDPMQFMRSFMGTEGEAKMQEAMASFEVLHIHTVAEEMAEMKADWSYEPEGYDMHSTKYGHFDVMWLKPGSEEKFDELNKEWVGFFKDLGYPYPYHAHEIHFGDSGRVVYVTFTDDLSAYYGENSLMKLIEAKGMGERWQKMDELFGGTVHRWEHYEETLRMDLSYWPMEEGATE
ncbi:MAG: hypothetical protein JSU87_08860 [Gemmatimonadota bacterium]|nr:MAG: hypothetical protein JSU87_08860 [Gemmatimonadota bacterium]